jgi:hypothetical protein
MTIFRRRPQPAPAIITREEAGLRIGRIIETMSRLTEVIVEETRLVRAGAYGRAGKLHEEKGKLSSRYMMDVNGLGANADAVAEQPSEAVEEIRRLHVAFRAALDENLAVLGTARGVAESLMRGVADGIAQKGAPKTYGAGGGYGAKPAAPAPVAISRGA